MKVILLKDVAKLGKRGSIVEVPDGFAQNKLLPNKMARPATETNIKQLQHEAEVKAHAQAHSLDDFKKLITDLHKNPCEFAVHSNKEGHLFEALKPQTIAERISVNYGLPLLSSEIVLSMPIKSLGEHTIILKRAGHEENVSIIIKHV